MQETVADPLVLGPLCPSFPTRSWLGDVGCALAANEALTLTVGGLLVVGIAVVAVIRERQKKKALQGPTFLVFPLNSRPRAGREEARGSESEEPQPSEGSEGHEEPSSSSADNEEPSSPSVDDPSADNPPNPPAADRSPDPSSDPQGAPPTYPWQQATSEDPEAPPGNEARDPATERIQIRPEDRAKSAPATSPSVDGPPPPTWVEAGPVRFEQPPDGTLQLLPGRLEIQSGGGQGREIRFVRLPGSEPEITLGRSDGPPYRHIQLRSPTVSRRHARLRFGDGRWTIQNESQTNPTVLNGRPLGSPDQRPILRDGDRIEMGEITFLFRQPEAGDRLPFRSSWYSDQGRRPTNQDVASVRTFSDGRELAVVCDGMGSLTAGELASREALDTVVQHLAKGAGLVDAIRAANGTVREQAQGDPDRAGMGSTLVALLREDDHYHIANVGDSRAYHITEEEIRQITEDHSFVAEVVKEGRMSADEAARSPWKNAVTRHLGAEAEVDVDLFGPFSTEEPHLVVLSSDGVHSVLSEDRIREVVRSVPQVQDTARALGEEALRSGSDDNVTVVVLEFGGGLPGA